MSNRPLPQPSACPRCEAPTSAEWTPGLVYSVAKGFTVPAVSDEVLFYRCTDCGAAWHRFDLTSRLHHVAQAYMDKAGMTCIPSTT